MSWPFTVAWGLIFGAGLIVEIIAIVRKGKGDTLTEHVRAGLATSPLVWFTAAGFFLWLAVHFFGFGIVDGWVRDLA